MLGAKLKIPIGHVVSQQQSNKISRFLFYSLFEKFYLLKIVLFQDRIGNLEIMKPSCNDVNNFHSFFKSFK